MRETKEPATVHTSLRARLIGLGDAELTARFAVATEPKDFTVKLPSEEVARELGQHVHHEVDVVLRIRRDDDGIEGGELISFEPLASGDAATAWREWFKQAGAGWENVEDIEGELHGD